MKSLSFPLIISTWDFGAEANRVAWKILMSRGNPLDAVERAINAVEKDPGVTSVGYGGIPNADGFMELDAAIMLGPNHKAGAVAGLKEIATPISVARKVMEKTNSILLVGDEALKFASRNGFKKTNLLTEKAKQEWLKRGEEGTIKRMDSSHDTIGLVLLDSKRDIYAGCSTSGLAMKTPGRVGDSSIIGAGLYVDNEIGGAVATGVGEQTMMFCGSFLVVENMRRGMSPQQACEATIKRMLSKGQKKWVGFIALDKEGQYGAASLGKEFPFAICCKKGELIQKSRIVDNLPNLGVNYKN